MTCFWASPENYRHIATKEIRRLDITWQDNDVIMYEFLKAKAEKMGITLAELMLELARQSLENVDRS